jgi:hypothetical protein
MLHERKGGSRDRSEHADREGGNLCQLQTRLAPQVARTEPLGHLGAAECPENPQSSDHNSFDHLTAHHKERSEQDDDDGGRQFP